MWLRWATCLIVAATLVGCDAQPARQSRRAQSRGNQSEAYLRGVAATLNDLPNQINLELLPALPILTASTSADGNEVRATCTENPQSPDGSINYIRVSEGNANFRSLDVQPGDVIRYFVNVDQEVAERGIEQRTAIELRVRRLDALDPQNALIIEGSLTGPVTEPQRLEIWRYSDKRMDAIRTALYRYESKRRPPAGWEPSPDLAALRQMVEHANQWLRNQPAKDDWQPEPMIAELPAELRSAEGVATAIDVGNLRDGVFAEWEGRLLQQAVWCRDISQWAGGNIVTDPPRQVAATLFDWVVRNVQLDGEEESAVIHHPWQALVYGHGNAAHRAWTFVELCRQQDIDAAVVRREGDEKAPLLAAALIEGEIYLFDPQLGLPLGGTIESPATLKELLEDPDRLKQLDVEGEFDYPLKADDLKSLEAFLVASPLQLSRRSARLENGLEGENFVKLVADVQKQSERFQQTPQIKRVSLWTEPFEALHREQTIKIPDRRRAAAEFAPFAHRPLLWKARVLHFQGNKDVRVEERNDPLADPRLGHQDALVLYQDRTVRPPKSVLAKVEGEKRTVYRAAKAEASYWLGLLSYDRGKYETAEAWLGERTLEGLPKGRWADGARYNLARTYEAQGNIEKAIELLRSDPPDAPQRNGNLVRAERLRRAAAQDKNAGQPQTAQRQ